MTSVLVIDSDDSTGENLARLGREVSDIQFILASAGDEGLRLARERRPDLILLDARPADSDWLVLLRTLDAEYPAIPVVVTTSDESTGQVMKAFRAGACDCVDKPVTPAVMDRIVDHGLRKAKERREQQRLAHDLRQTTQRLRRQQEELNAVHVIGRLTTSLLDLDVVLDRLTEIALHMTDAHETMLLLRADDRDELYVRAGKNVRGPLENKLRVELNSGIVAEAMRSGEPVVVTGTEAQAAPGGPAEALLYIPVRAPNQAIGLLTLSSYGADDAFSERDILLLSTLVDYAAIAIQNARLFERIAESKELMDGVFSSIASGVITLDGDERVSLINQAARSLLRAPDAAVGASLTAVCPAMAKKLEPLMKAAREQRGPTGPLEVDVPLAPGETVTFRTSLAPLRRGSDPAEGVTIVFEDLTKQRRLESRFRLFQRYVSPSVIERLPDDPEELELGGVRRNVACLFADLRGFVDFSLQHPPERLMETLNRYLGLGAEAVLAEEGTLDKFVGDAVVAFFNAPLAQKDCVLRALRAAVQIQEETIKLHTRVSPTERLTYGIGISVGEAIVGNIGTPQRLDYTAIGPSVNLANRLQSAASPGQILVTPEVYERAQDHVIARPVVLERFVGRDEPYQAYELLDLL